MIKNKHVFHDNTSVPSNGIDFKMVNKSTNSVLVVSCGKAEGSSASSAKVLFYGKTLASDVFVPIKAIKSSDFTLVSEGSINEGYLIDCSSYDIIRIMVDDIVGGSVTVVGELVDNIAQGTAFYDVASSETPTIEVESLSVTENGTYTAPTGKAYSPVEVNVSGGGKYAPSYISFAGYMGDNLNYELANLDTSNLTSMYRMFYDCENLTSVDFSGFDTSNVESMRELFYICGSLSSVDLGGIDISNVNDIGGMFRDCSSLEEIDFSGLDTSNVTDMSELFEFCSNLSTINLNGIDTSKVEDMNFMFSSTEISEMDLTDFDFSNAENIGGLFSRCSSLASVLFGSHYSDAVLDVSNMFLNCKLLTEIDMSNANFPNADYFRSMFDGCTSLEKIDIRNFSMSTSSDFDYAFQGVPDNCLIIVKDDTEKTFITTEWPNLTNVKTVEEYEAV